MFSILSLIVFWGCVEPPPSATEGSNEPGGAAKPGAPNPGDAPPVGADGAAGPAGAVDATVVPTPHDGSMPDAPTAQFSQAEITDGVTLNLDLICGECTGSLLVRIEDTSTQPPTLLTQKSFEKAGKSTMLTPSGKNVVLMIVDDANNNEQPTPGEAIGLWTGGILDTSSATETLTLEVGVVPDTPPIPPSEDAMPNEAAAEELPPANAAE
ncbi:MAG: hypothetical protein ACPGTU_13050 [Myxococcota bacterium]